MINFDILEKFHPQPEKSAEAPFAENQSRVQRNIDLILADEKITPKISEIVKILGTVAELVSANDSGFIDNSQGLPVELHRRGPVEIAIDSNYHFGGKYPNKKLKPVPYLSFEFRFDNLNSTEIETNLVPGLGRKGFAEDISKFAKEEDRYQFIVRKNQDTGEFITKFWTSTKTATGISETDFLDLLLKNYTPSEFSRQIPPEDMGQRNSSTNERKTEDPEQVLYNLQAVARRLTETLRAKAV